jgi:hypothetical protein
MNNSEQHRRDCEARHVLKMNDTDRQEYYKGVIAKRGRVKVNELIDDVNRMRREAREKEIERV